MTFPNAFETLNVLAQQTLLPPSQLPDAVPASDAATRPVSSARHTVAPILHGQPARL